MIASYLSYGVPAGCPTHD